MDHLLLLNPLGRSGTVIQPPGALCSIFVKKVFIIKGDIIYQSVMKTVSGHPQLCHAKVIQTTTKKNDFPF